MSGIREKRKFNFTRKVITPETIRALATIINNEIEKSNALKSNEISSIFSVDANDNSSYESQSVSIFNEGEIIDRKVILKVGMKFNTVDYSKHIEVQVSYSLANNQNENYITVSGDDPTWVNGIMSQFHELLALTRQQPNYNPFFGWGIFSLYIVFAVVYKRIVIRDIAGFINDKDIAESILMVGWIGAGLGSFPLYEYLKHMWPAIELQTGADYLNISAKKRRKLIWILGSILVPLALSALYDLLRAL